MSHNEVNLKVCPILGFTSFTNTPFLSFIKLLRVLIFILSLSITFYASMSQSNTLNRRNPNEGAQE